MADENAPKGIDVTTPHIARIYDYWLGGKDNYAADREAAEQVMKATPTIRPGVTANRAFLSRAVRYMVGQDVTQFLDIGTGIPTADNTHLVAQAANPQSRVVYVDNDPTVHHARALLSGVTAPTSFIDADLRDTDKILQEAANLLDFKRPVGLLLIAVLHCIPDAENRGASSTPSWTPWSPAVSGHHPPRHRPTARTDEGRRKGPDEIDGLPGDFPYQRRRDQLLHRPGPPRPRRSRRPGLAPGNDPEPVRHNRHVGRPGPQTLEVNEPPPAPGDDAVNEASVTNAAT